MSSINVTVQSVQKTVETATLQYIAEVEVRGSADTQLQKSARHFSIILTNDVHVMINKHRRCKYRRSRGSERGECERIVCKCREGVYRS